MSVLDFLGLRRRRRQPERRPRIIQAAQEQWAAREFVNQVVEQVDAAELRDLLTRAGYTVDPDGRLIERPGTCCGCGRRERHLHRALNSDQWLCALCWTSDHCET